MVEKKTSSARPWNKDVKKKRIHSNEQFLSKCELEIDIAQQQLDTIFLNSVGINEYEQNEFADMIIFNRLKRLYKDAQIVFKHNPKVAEQFNFETILTIVTSI